VLFRSTSSRISREILDEVQSALDEMGWKLDDEL